MQFRPEHLSIQEQQFFEGVPASLRLASPMHYVVAHLSPSYAIVSEPLCPKNMRELPLAPFQLNYPGLFPSIELQPFQHPLAKNQLQASKTLEFGRIFPHAEPIPFHVQQPTSEEERLPIGL